MLCVRSESNRRDQLQGKGTPRSHVHMNHGILVNETMAKRSESANITQSMNDVDSTSTRACSYDFDSSTLKSKFTFTKLL